jgi:hypothetical protein
MLAILVATLGTVPAAATDKTDEESNWSGNIGIGAEYDSNVAILELDATSGEGDYAALIDLGVGYDRDLGDNADIKLGYDFSQSLHDQFSEFDLRLHRGSVGAGYDFGFVDGGIMGQYVHASLDGDKFLVFKQVSPYLSKLFGDRLYLRAAYAYTDKDYTNNPGRTAAATSLSTNAYVFLNGLDTYLMFGYKHDDEDAVEGRFDYVGQRFSTQLTQRVHALQRTLVFKARLQYEERDYSEPTPSIGAERRDERYRLKTSLEIPLSEHIAANTLYEYADNRSNLPAVDFDQHVVSIGLKAEF